jgi:dihydrofolate synthase/folylpolyglutamate synthase
MSPCPIADRAAALRFLYGRIDYERTPTVPYQEHHFKLERMVRLCELLDNPQQRLKVVHVAGSKGKGSTATMIASVLTAAGYQTGLYTSPHLECPEERIVVDGRQCTADEFVGLTRDLFPIVQRMEVERPADEFGQSGPTYFEIMTAMAMLYFVRRNVDVAVLEVGLGGRLDSTNVCWPLVAVITSISRDHTRQLGSTLTQIAKEKAGIIKRGIPVVSGVRHPPAQEVIQESASMSQAPLHQVGRDFDIVIRSRPTDIEWSAARGTPSFDYWHRLPGAQWSLSELQLEMPGHHQVANAAVALTALSLLRETGWAIDEGAVRAGLRSTWCPARVEVVQRDPTVVLDGAHNEASVDALIRTLNDVHPHGQRVVVFGTTRGKEVMAMLSLLAGWADELVLTRYLNNPRSHSPAYLETLVRQLPPPANRHQPVVIVSESPAEAWDWARGLLRPGGMICITGSMFLAAEMKPLLSGVSVPRVESVTG